MSLTPFLRFPSLSEGLSLPTQLWLDTFPGDDNCELWLRERPLPAELLNEIGSVLGDFLWKLDHVDASQDDIVGFHWIWT